MRRFWRQRPSWSKQLRKAISTLLVLPVAAAALICFRSEMGTLPEKAALLSAMVNMPEGSLALLEERFGDQIDQAYYHGKESEVEPYVQPWENTDEEENPSSSQPQSRTKDADSSDDASPAEVFPAKVQNARPAQDKAPDIPAEYRGTILQENMSVTAVDLVEYGNGKLRNYTEVPDEEVKAIMEQGMNIHLEQTNEPQVLIFHTHATESYEALDTDLYDMRNAWRTTDNTQNMVAVGDALEKALTDAGIGVIHDTTQHDYPSYNGAYERSAETVKKWLEEYPSIKIALDVHRDAIQREEDLIVKPVVEVNGKKAAQLMIITGSDDGTMNIPEWQQNLRFAGCVQDAIETDIPGLTRPIFFCYRKYNMDLTTGSLLLEVGSNANTLEESIYTAQLVGQSIARLLGETAQQPASE